MAITITGWGAFWVGVFGLLAICELADIAKTALQTHCITKAVKHLTHIDPELLEKAIKGLIGEVKK